MREDELRKHAICSKCKNRIGHTGVPIFWTLKIDRIGIKMDAIQRQQGLAMMLGGNALLAQVMGPNEDMTQPMMDTIEITLCEECAHPIMELIEKCGLWG
jgi:hypothetical protein